MRQELFGVKYFCRSTSTILAGSDGCSFDHAPFGGRRRPHSVNVRLGTFTECGSRARRLPKGGASGCYASPREDVRRERLGRSRDRFRTGDAQESRRSAIPAWPPNSGAALDAFPPPIFRGADTRTHHRIRAGRSDAGIFLPARDRGSESDSATHAPPLSPRPRRASASDRPSRSPPRSCRPT